MKKKIILKESQYKILKNKLKENFFRDPEMVKMEKEYFRLNKKLVAIEHAYENFDTLTGSSDEYFDLEKQYQMIQARMSELSQKMEELENGLNENTDEWNFDFSVVDIDISEENFNETKMLRNKYPMFPNLGVGTFLSSVILWRIVDEQEMEHIKRTNKITGGNYSIPAERNFGASFSGSRQDVIEWGLRNKQNGRLNGNLFVIGIQAEDKEFLNLNMVERLENQGLEYSVNSFKINTELGNTGLGFSVRNVTKNDILSIHLLNDETKELKEIY